MDYLRAGVLPGVKIGSVWRIRESEFEAYIDDLERQREQEKLHSSTTQGETQAAANDSAGTSD